MQKSFLTLFVVAALGCVSLTANAGPIVTNAETEHPNKGLGTPLDTLGDNDLFPCANVVCKDKLLKFSGAAGPLGKQWIHAKQNGGSPFGENSLWLSNLGEIKHSKIPRKDLGGATGSDSLSPTDRVIGVPEPGTMGLMGLALLGIAFARRRSRKQY